MKKLIKGLLEKLGLRRTVEGQIPIMKRQLTNFLFYTAMFERIGAVNGAVVECGVGKGRSFLYFNFLAEREDKERIVWGFDSFEGFPEPAPEDDSARKPKKGDWSDVSIGYIRSVLKTAGISESWASAHTRLVKGFFSDSLSSYDGGPIALLHVDADLYESYKDVLTAFFPLVAQNGLVLFDEYNEPKWPGAKRAVDEYFANTPYVIENDTDSGKYFLIKRG